MRTRAKGICRKATALGARVCQDRLFFHKNFTSIDAKNVLEYKNRVEKKEEKYGSLTIKRSKRI